MTARLGSKVIVVTRRNSGSGGSVAERVAAEGGAVVIGARPEDVGGEVAARVRDGGGRALFVPTDVTVEADVAELVRRAVAEFGGLDGAYNGAGGVSSSGAVQEIDEAEWRADIDANLTSVYLSLKHELPAILRRRRDRQQRGARRRRRGRGHVAERRGQAWGDRLARAVALECADRGVRVNALVTGTVSTPLLRRLLCAPLGDELDAPALNPAGRVSEPEEIAALVASC